MKIISIIIKWTYNLKNTKKWIYILEPSDGVKIIKNAKDARNFMVPNIEDTNFRQRKFS